VTLCNHLRQMFANSVMFNPFLSNQYFSRDTQTPVRSI